MLLDKEDLEKESKFWYNRLTKRCNICNGKGIIEFKDKKPQECTCAKQVRVNTLLCSWGVPRKYLQENWQWNTIIEKPFVKKCKQYADEFENNYLDNIGMFLYGGQGRGKSTMEVLIAKDIAKKINPDTGKNYTIAFCIYEDLIQLSFQRMKDNKAFDKFNILTLNPDLLIIDNLGSETGIDSDSGHNKRLLETILRNRIDKCMPTIISSNYTLDEIKNVYCDTIHDLIQENCIIVNVFGDNFRKNVWGN